MRKDKIKMNELEIMNNNQIIKKIYKGEEDKIDNIIKEANKEIKDELKVINIENIIDNVDNPREIRNILNDIEDNYNIKQLFKKSIAIFKIK